MSILFTFPHHLSIPPPPPHPFHLTRPLPQDQNWEITGYFPPHNQKISKLPHPKFLGFVMVHPLHFPPSFITPPYPPTPLPPNPPPPPRPKLGNNRVFSPHTAKKY